MQCLCVNRTISVDKISCSQALFIAICFPIPYLTHSVLHNDIQSWCPESLRWLVVNNRVRAANAIVHKAAKMNKVTLPEFPFGEPPPKKEKSTDDDTEKGCCGGCCKSDDDGAPAAKSEFLPYLRAPKPRRYFIIMMYLL